MGTGWGGKKGLMPATLMEQDPVGPHFAPAPSSPAGSRPCRDSHCCVPLPVRTPPARGGVGGSAAHQAPAAGSEHAAGPQTLTGQHSLSDPCHAAYGCRGRITTPGFS